MKEYCLLNMSKMLELSNRLDGSEVKMLFAIIYCLINNSSNLFVNNASNRDIIANLGFKKTSARFSSLLGSLVKKGILKREANGVYSLLEELAICS